LNEARTTPAKHVFLDVVGFTRNRSVEAQTDIVRYLNSFVRDSLRRYPSSSVSRLQRALYSTA
jgi:hypothetical protein